MLKPGTYRARAKRAELGYTSKGTEQVAVTFEVEGHTLTWFGFFTDKTADSTLRGLAATGWRGDNLSDLSGVGTLECEVVVVMEPDLDGRDRTRIRWVNRPGSGGVELKKPMGPAERQAFAERMRGKAIVMRENEPEPTQSTQQQNRQPPPGEDLPPEAFPQPGDDDFSF